MRRLLLFLALLIVVVAAAFVAEQWEFFAPGPPASRGNATIIWVKSGERAAAIARDLQNAGVVKNAALFRFGVWLRGKNAALKAGEFAISSRASMAGVMGILTSGKPIQHRITIAEGLTSGMIFDIVRKNPILVGNAGTVPAEGSLLPETYLFIRGTTRAELLARMARAQQRFLAKRWPTRAASLPFTSQEDAVTLASIVEKETGNSDERPEVASVYYNRLEKHMALQADPSVIYAELLQGDYSGALHHADMQFKSDYNTYSHPGLPPGPIGNPGKSALEAAMHPATTDYFYFVSDGNGHHRFAHDLEEHNRNVAAFRKAVQQR